MPVGVLINTAAIFLGGIVGALVLLLSLVLANNYQAMRLIRSFFASGIAVVLFLLVVPGIVLCTAARKKEVSQ